MDGGRDVFDGAFFAGVRGALDARGFGRCVDGFVQFGRAPELAAVETDAA